MAKKIVCCGRRT